MIKNYILLLMLIALLSSCTGIRCFGPDDFGFVITEIPSRYDEDVFKNQGPHFQVGPWVDTKLYTNGNPISSVVAVWAPNDASNNEYLSVICPWYGTQSDKHKLSTFCEKLRFCEFQNNNPCTKTEYVDITNAPCLLGYGLGGYILLAPETYDPNQSLEIIASPDTSIATVFHLGEPYIKHDSNTAGLDPSDAKNDLFAIGSDGKMHVTGGLVTPFPHANYKVWVKFLDTYYLDNAGEYKLEFKTGITGLNENPLDIIQELSNKIQNIFFGKNSVTETIYKQVISNTYYKSAIGAILAIYICISGALFVINPNSMKLNELLIRALKVILLSILIQSQYSWDFFYNYFFVFFTSGLETIIQIILDSGASGPGSSSILDLMIAKQTLAKLLSLLFMDWKGFIYIIVYFIALFFIVLMQLSAIITYLIAIMMIATGIIVWPIFLWTILFPIFSRLITNLIRHFISYSLQVIILFTGISLLSLLIRNQIYKSLGFAVCQYGIFQLAPSLAQIVGQFTQHVPSFLQTSILYWWFPAIALGMTNQVKEYIYIPNGFFKEVDGQTTYCKPYECIGERYVDFPFLNPDDPNDLYILHQFFNGNYVQLESVFVLWVYAYLLFQFIGIAVSSAKFLSSTSMNLTSMSSLANRTSAPFTSQFTRGATYPIRRAALFAAPAIAMVSGLPRAGIEVLKDKYLEREALSGSSNSAVLSEVAKSTGLHKSNINRHAANEYRANISDALKEVMPNISKSDLKSHSKKLSRLDEDSLRDELSRIYSGDKDGMFSGLNQEGKDRIDNLMNKKRSGDKSISILSHEVERAKEFQKAYVDAHHKLSDDGVGFFGKRNKTLRKLQSFKKRKEDAQSLERARKLALGHKFYGALDALNPLYKEHGSPTQSIEYDDPRLRTGREKLRDQEENIKRREFRKNIESMSRNGINILSPESLARIKRSDEAKYKHYIKLRNESLRHTIHEALTQGDNPAIMGDKFIRTKAKDSDIKSMIDLIYQKTAKAIENDIYIKRAREYRARRKESNDNINEIKLMLEVSSDRSDINLDNIVPIYKQYLESNQSQDGLDTNQINKLVNSLQRDIVIRHEMQSNLDEVNARKDQMKSAADEQVGKLNQERKKLGMREYLGQPIRIDHD
ncbi:MAG: type IV secretion system protein [Rickettsiaceae bacterium]